MASLIPGYEYDIFISYRQKDNKHEGWVTKFVDNLKGELESTFKEEISVYFDINPQDGLLETHDVDASLKEKLNCLVFIPIISRTYCDPKSFAWEHEFKEFVEQASHDQFGLKVKLPNGNVANRVLPVRIHDLDNDDMKLCESVLDGVLRGVDFIYKEPGVDRPLTSDDDEKKNLNKTKYRNQVNKVALAIKEIITAIKKHSQQEGEVPKEVVKAKTERPKKLKPKVIIASFFVLALIVLGYLLIPKFKPKEQLEKSIAVLPFRNDTSNDSTTYFMNGVMEEILNNLQKIKDFSRVLSRNSVEQFRNNTTKSTSEIAKKLGVNYIVEGSGQKYGNKFVLRVQLLAAGNEKHLWGKSFDKEIRKTTDIIDIQSQIAQAIAAELKAAITPEEKQLIEKKPTGSLTAYDFYQRGKDELTKYEIDNYNKDALIKSEDLFHKALKYDSTYAQAYTGLALVYWNKHSSAEDYFSKNTMDSVLILSDIALSFDSKLAEAYTIRGNYFTNKGVIDKAVEEYDKSLNINPNSWEAFVGKGNIYSDDDLVSSIDNLQKAASINHGLKLPGILRNISLEYSSAGFIDKAKDYDLEAFKLDGDSALYLNYLALSEKYQGNCERALEYLNKGYSIDTTQSSIITQLGMCYMLLKKSKESLKYYNKYVEVLNALGTFTLNDMHRIGWAYWENGYEKQAEFYFAKQIEYCKNEIKLKRPWGQSLYLNYDMAGVYAFKGDKKKAYENLKIFNRRQSMPIWVVMFIKKDPLFDSIRNEPEFQQIARDVEAKYQAEHERVRKWLEEQGTL